MKCLLAFVDTSNTSLFVFLYGCYLCAQRRDAMQVSDCLFDHSALYIHIESTYKNKSQIRLSALSPRTAILKSTQLTFEVGWRNTTPVAFRHSLSSTSLPSTATRHTVQFHNKDSNLDGETQHLLRFDTAYHQPHFHPPQHATQYSPQHSLDWTPRCAPSKQLATQHAAA
jgi:hypothetical protein